MYLKCFAVAMIGFAIQFLLKFNSMRKKAVVGNNSDFTFKSFMSDDWPALSAGILFIVLCLFLIDEILNLAPAVLDKILALFTLVGYFNSDLALRLFSVANKKLNETINYKTDVADGKINTNI